MCRTSSSMLRPWRAARRFKRAFTVSSKWRTINWAIVNPKNGEPVNRYDDIKMLQVPKRFWALCRDADQACDFVAIPGSRARWLISSIFPAQPLQEAKRATVKFELRGNCYKRVGAAGCACHLRDR